MKQSNPWEFRNKLSAILSAAKYCGATYVDVDSARITGDTDGPLAGSAIPICHDIMSRLMRPGDSILRESGEGEHGSMTIRYRL